MRMLVLGGTGWLGRRVALAAIEAGHDVSCVARGTAAPDRATLLRADRDRDDALAAAAGLPWDAVVDVSSQPGQVRRAVRDLAPVAARYLCVSSCNAYASLAQPGVEETAELNTPLRSDAMALTEQYGAAKVACEQAVLEGFGEDRTVILRPGLIGGPGDPTGRSSYWPLRFARPSNSERQAIVPGMPSDDGDGTRLRVSDQPVSVIDVRDLADWMLRLVETGGSGIFNAAGDPMTMREYLALAAAASGGRATPVPVRSSRLTEWGVAQWAGPRSLPLWIEAPEVAGIHSLSQARACAAGLRLRPQAETLADILAWGETTGIATANGAGLSDDEERELLSVVAFGPDA